MLLQAIFSFKNASTYSRLAEAVKSFSDHKVETKIIGTRHGEKLYETLVSREEMSRVVDHSSFFRLPLDDRDLNYSAYFSEGELVPTLIQEYNSHNAVLLNASKVADLLSTLNLFTN